MAYADKTASRAYQRRWYHANKAKRAAMRRRNHLRIRSWYEEFKETLRCERCGENHPACLVFHHRDMRSKRFTISHAVGRAMSIAMIQREMAKCDVLCINCHFLAHAESTTRRQRKLPSRKMGASRYALES